MLSPSTVTNKISNISVQHLSNQALRRSAMPNTTSMGNPTKPQTLISAAARGATLKGAPKSDNDNGTNGFLAKF